MREDNERSNSEKKKKPIIWKTKKREAAKSVAGTVPNEPTNSEHVHKSVDYLKEFRMKRE